VRFTGPWRAGPEPHTARNGAGACPDSDSGLSLARGRRWPRQVGPVCQRVEGEKERRAGARGGPGLGKEKRTGPHGRERKGEGQWAAGLCSEERKGGRVGPTGLGCK
jgi:hypothetical protein